MRVGATTVYWEEMIYQATIMQYFAADFFFGLGCKHVYRVGMERGESR